MADNPKKGPRASEDVAGRGVDALATQALSVVASQGQRQKPINTALLERLDAAARKGDHDGCLAVVADMKSAGINAEEVAERYIPELARRMGDEWCEDSMSFAEVTIGVSRLQSLLRDLGPEWRADRHADPYAPAALVVVALDDYHTLGAMILSGQLRRRGLSVKLQLGSSPESLSATLEDTDYDAVLISASVGESLETLRRLVKAVRTTKGENPPVVIGGAIVDEHDALSEETGANFATSDVDEALEHCGLTIIPTAKGRQGRRT